MSVVQGSLGRESWVKDLYEHNAEPNNNTIGLFGQGHPVQIVPSVSVFNRQCMNIVIPPVLWLESYGWPETCPSVVR